MLQQPEPEDFVIATGEQHSVREFVVRAAGELGMQIEWRGSGASEQGIDATSGRTIVEVDPHYYRPTEVDALLGDASKAHAALGWRPQISFDELVKEMIAADLALAQRDAAASRAGFRTYRNRE
jgi:GDPmannose 4,6-dehydratase